MRTSIVVHAQGAISGKHKKRSPAATGLRISNKNACQTRDITTRPALPPYGVDVERAIRDVGNPNVFLYTGPRAWKMAKARRALCGTGSALVLPDGNSAERFRWPKLHCLLINAVDLPRDHAIQVGVEIAKQGTSLVVVAFEGSRLAFVRRNDSKVVTG